MKNVKFLLSAACALFAVAAMAQQDFSDPKYAVWGDTPQEREQNILNSNFLKESLDNKDYNAAAHYLKELLDKCPKASQNTFVRGITLYKNKIARAKSIAEKNTYTDSLMIVYDLRNEYFGDHPKYGTPYILDRKAREYLMYKPTNDGRVLRIAFPQLTEDRRKELCKQVSKICEESKVAVRNVRRDALDKLKAKKKNSEITEDDLKEAEKNVQKITDKYIETIDAVGADKDKEIMSI